MGEGVRLLCLEAFCKRASAFALACQPNRRIVAPKLVVNNLTLCSMDDTLAGSSVARGATEDSNP
jgi:hypothetical protein